MARPNPLESARTFVSKGGMPITLSTIILVVAMFIAWWLSSLDSSWLVLIFESDNWIARPWSLVTYAFLNQSFGYLVCSCLMAFFFMGALERAWSKERFIPAYVAFLIAPPIAVWLGAVASGTQLFAMGTWLPVASWTVAFGSYRPQATILVFGVIPVKGMWIAWISALAVVFMYGAGAPLAGFCVGLSMVVAYLLGSRRMSIAMPQPKQPPGDEFRRSLKTKRDSEAERLKLRELLERSVHEDEEKP